MEMELPHPIGDSYAMTAAFCQLLDMQMEIANAADVAGAFRVCAFRSVPVLFPFSSRSVSVAFPFRSVRFLVLVMCSLWYTFEPNQQSHLFRVLPAQRCAYQGP